LEAAPSQPSEQGRSGVSLEHGQNQKMRRIRNTASATLAPKATSANKVDPSTNASVPIFLLGFGMSDIGMFAEMTRRAG